MIRIKQKFRHLSATTVALLAVCGAIPCSAAEPGKDGESALRLKSHEPNLLGYTWDKSGQYMDFTLSVKFKVLEKSIYRTLSEHDSVNFAFTGRFGQYFERDSSPVISKRFNPELFYRHELSESAFFETGYAHESNGQSITSLASYQQAQQTLEHPGYADDNLSRGWDYVRLTLRSPEYQPFGAKHPVHTWVTAKWFLRNGLFQGKPEEYKDFENDSEGKPRNQVDGVTVGVRYRPLTPLAWLPGGNLAVTYTTGYREIFRYNSVRLEAGVKLFDLPMIVWGARGYNSDLARYYRDIVSAGIAIEIGVF